MEIDDPVEVRVGDMVIGIGTIAGEPRYGKISVRMDGHELFHIDAPAHWFTATPLGGFILSLPPRT